MNFFKKLKESLKKTSEKFTKGIDEVFNKSKPQAEILQDIEDILIQADVGINFVEEFRKNIANKKYSKEELTKENFFQAIAQEIEEILIPLQKDFFSTKHNKPTVVLVCGVNGVGKTTTIGKLCKKLKDQGNKIIVGAADTFRAAAIDQLELWCKKINVEIIKSNIGSDPASVAFKSFEYAKQNNADYCVIDTAGRLQNKKNLMEEFSKIIRVLKKIDNNAPHETILVLDATTGQNAINQIEEFKKITPITGIIMTKLDGTAKGGILVAIAKQFKIPIYAIGIGEKEEDLDNFIAKDFVQAFIKN
ncbi:MAG: signal recognition particle-docking protein FtsY [Candidatus Fonsibacter sp.]